MPWAAGTGAAATVGEAGPAEEADEAPGELGKEPDAALGSAAEEEAVEDGADEGERSGVAGTLDEVAEAAAGAAAEG